jgi:hypothetical protein
VGIETKEDTMSKKPRTETAYTNALAYRQDDARLSIGEVVTVIKEFYRNGEFWCRLSDGREFPSVAFYPRKSV